jgi:hypothetical protein
MVDYASSEALASTNRTRAAANSAAANVAQTEDSDTAHYVAGAAAARDAPCASSQALLGIYQYDSRCASSQARK